MMRLSDDSLRGRTVIASDGLAVGELSALFIDSDAWRVESLRVKLRKDIADRLGANRSMFHAGALEIPTSLIQSVGDASASARNATDGLWPRSIACTTRRSRSTVSSA
jgi:sporulation protein YlmC with PRC-barrel domain